MDTRFGHPDDWGLSPQRHSEIANELSDHLDCLQADQGGEVAKAAEEKLAEPKVRRRLTAAHIADQVVATLHRWPSRSEWRELGWLLFWFVMVFVAEFVTVDYQSLAIDAWRDGWRGFDANPDTTSLAMLSWLLLAASRGMFFLVLAKGVRDAWQRGWGVLIARLLQYKLIHTLMVTAGVAWLSQIDYSLVGRISMPSMHSIPTWLLPLLAGLLLLLSAALAMQPGMRRQAAWLAPLAVLFFLLPTAPTNLVRIDIRQPLPTELDHEDATHRFYRPVEGREAILLKMQGYLRSNGRLPNGWSLEDPYLKFIDHEIVGPPLNAAWWESEYLRPGKVIDKSGRERVYIGRSEERSAPYCTGPMVTVGSGLAWIAAPVPLMGIIGLLAMLFIMGRRGVLPAFLYTLITMIALYCSVLPFVMTQKLGELVVLNPTAVSHGPLPGFEQILRFNSLHEGTMIMGALLLSAGIPWLLTGLFLRGEQGNAEPVDDDGELATG